MVAVPGVPLRRTQSAVERFASLPEIILARQEPLEHVDLPSAASVKPCRYGHWFLAAILITCIRERGSRCPSRRCPTTLLVHTGDCTCRDSRGRQFRHWDLSRAIHPSPPPPRQTKKSVFVLLARHYSVSAAAAAAAAAPGAHSLS